jgi:hypothetical protein
VECLALDILQHEVALANVVDLANVRVIQCGYGPRFLLEAP